MSTSERNSPAVDILRQKRKEHSRWSVRPHKLQTESPAAALELLVPEKSRARTEDVQQTWKQFAQSGLDCGIGRQMNQSRRRAYS